MHLIPLPALSDNYIWLLHDGSNALVVDPGDAEVVEHALGKHQLALRSILLTHHHADHIAGADMLARRWNCTVHAPEDPRIAATTHGVSDGQHLRFTQPAAHFVVIAVPGHTRSHVAYAGEGLLFSGDTLFSLGCGRLFEGTPAQMLASLDRLARLPVDTLVCAAHEYTAANGRFAATIEPDNRELATRRKEVDRLRAAGAPSLPVTLDCELQCNPFLRVDSTPVMTWCRRSGIDAGDRIARFAALRSAKDHFQ